jgi:hypothetical protein
MGQLEWMSRVETWRSVGGNLYFNLTINLDGRDLKLCERLHPF